ncbi:hypothetical protein GALL_493440 [mine drainage metagenome]|uniref:Uncharacterized protein n=1 Tax=mine drainage metagenome TaxID=410659 RepID=A0A1J5PCV3_9ZZZZ
MACPNSIPSGPGPNTARLFGKVCKSNTFSLVSKCALNPFNTGGNTGMLPLAITMRLAWTSWPCSVSNVSAS